MEEVRSGTGGSWLEVRSGTEGCWLEDLRSVMAAWIWFLMPLIPLTIDLKLKEKYFYE